MINYLNRISISERVSRMMLDDSRFNEKVVFTYLNVKTDKESDINDLTLLEAIKLAEVRREDGRYKNFEFIIS